MDKQEALFIKTISKYDAFTSIIAKLTKNETLTSSESTCLLSLAICLLNCYKSDHRRTQLLEFSYYLFLKYSLQSNDYRPLFDISTILGYFPIATTIANLKLISLDTVGSEIVCYKLSSFTTESGITETLQQRNRTTEFLSDDALERCYVAPTSFGKSSLITEYIRRLLSSTLKVAIIVPTKSLLIQTFRMVRASNLGRKIILHDEMYENEITFIGILTQERALRLLNRNQIAFDALIIDEAHDLLKFDSRSILLSRLISISKNLNQNLKIAYLSPLINDPNVLNISESQYISSHYIRHNIKEPDISLFNRDGSISKYNRFINKFFSTGNSEGFIQYIISNSLKKNFLYTNRPIRVEKLARELQISINAQQTNDPEIIELKKLLSKMVHPQYYPIKCLDAGVVYIHGKTPDLLKEYLEFKFKTVAGLKYIVANSVILEGINLPIDTLFILNTRGLNNKDLTNLIGRVNRLDSIFNNTEKGLKKLLPAIHFVFAEGHIDPRTNLETKIRALKSSIFEDEVKNPLLSNFDSSSLNEKSRLKVTEIIEQEAAAISTPLSKEDAFKKHLIEEGISSFYTNFSAVAPKIFAKINAIKAANSALWVEKSIINKVYTLFIESIEDYVYDYEFKRLAHDPARRYYNNFIFVKRKLSLSQNIAIDVKYFNQLKEGENPNFFFGTSFGEVPYPSRDYMHTNNPVYVNLSTKTNEELANLAVIKNKIESDFVNIKINRFIVFLYDFELITKEEYLLSIYGTTDENKIALTRIGLSLNLISKLEADKQIGNILINQDGSIVGNKYFSIFANSVDDFYRFELSKYIVWDQIKNAT